MFIILRRLLIEVDKLFSICWSLFGDSFLVLQVPVGDRMWANCWWELLTRAEMAPELEEVDRPDELKPDELEADEEDEALEIWLLELSELSELWLNEKRVVLLLSDSATCLLLLKRSADVIVYFNLRAGSFLLAVVLLLDVCTRG